MKIPVLSDLLNSYSTFIFDADGVLWLGDKVIPKSPDFVNFLLKNGKQVIVISNGTTLTIDGFVKKAQKMEYDLKEENIVTSSIVTGFELATIEKVKNGLIYVIGSEALQETLESFGLKCLGAGKDEMENCSEVSSIENQVEV